MIPQRKPIGTHCRFCMFRLCLCCKFLIPCHKACHLVGKAVQTRHLTAFPVKIPGQRRQRHDSTVILVSVLMMRDRCTGFIDAHRATFMNHAASLKHLLIGHTGQLFDIGTIESLYIFPILCKSMNILFNIFPVDPILFDQDISHTKCQSTISARIRAQVQIAKTLHCRRDLRIYDDHFHAVFPAIFYCCCLSISGIIRIHCPAKIQIGMCHIRSCQLSCCGFPRHPSCCHAGARFRSVIHGAKGMCQTAQPWTVPLVITAKKCHRIRSRLLLYLIQTKGNLLVCFLPADLLKFSLSALSDPF